MSMTDEVFRTVRTAVPREVAVVERLAGVQAELTAGPHRPFTYTSAPGQVDVHLPAPAASRGGARDGAEWLLDRVCDLLGVSVYGFGDDSLDEAVHLELVHRGATVAVVESLTGGLLAARLTSTPGASASFRGGVVAYATDTKASVVGVPGDLLAERGAVDGDVAGAMAAGAKSKFRSTYGLGLTGVAGPEQQDGKPVGTVYLGLAGPDAPTRAVALRLPGDRSHNRAHACVRAIDLLRRHLAGGAVFEPWEASEVGACYFL